MHLQVLEGFTSFCSPHHCAAYHSRLVRTPHASYPEALFQQIQQLWFWRFRQWSQNTLLWHRASSYAPFSYSVAAYCPSLHPYQRRIYCIYNKYRKGIFQPKCVLNHAAVNPMFSLFESLTHQEDFASQYRYMSEEEANNLFAQMVSSSDQNTYPLLNEEARKNGKPDILIIIMESFANDIMPSVGTHKDVAVCLDSIAKREFSSQDSIPTLSARIVVWLLFWAVILHNLQPASCATRQNLHNYHHWHVHWLKQSITAMHIIMVVMLILPTNALGWFPRAMRESFLIVISL